VRGGGERGEWTEEVGEVAATRSGEIRKGII